MSRLLYQLSYPAAQWDDGSSHRAPSGNRTRYLALTKGALYQ